jgi:hypothetical protein
MNNRKIRRISDSVLMTLLCACFQGCAERVEVRDDNTLPSFVSTGNVGKCGCVPQGLYLARAALGLPPLDNLVATGSADGLRNNVQEEATKIGSKLTVHSLDETLQAIEKAEARAQPLSILVHQNGHFYGLLGTIDIEGTRLFQLIHGNSQVWLASKEQMNLAGFKEVWHFQRAQESRGIPFRIGDGELVVDKVYKNFCEIKPFQEVNGTFVLENSGKTTIILGAPQTSCSCAVPSIKESTKLEPGETMKMEVVLRPGISTSTRETVIMKCHEEGN